MARKQIINPLVGFAQRSIGPYANRIGAATYARHVGLGDFEPPVVATLYAFAADGQEVLKGLVTGTGSMAFARASDASVTDFEPLVKTALANELRFEYGRRVENLWPSADGSDTPSTQIITVVSGSEYQLQIGAESTSGATAVCSGAFTGTLTADGLNVIAFDTAKTAASTSLTVTITGNIRKIQPEDVTGQSNQNPSEYVSVGVLSGDYHGVGVDGVKCFSTTNGTTVDGNNVVTEGTGATLADWYALSEPAATNECPYSKNLSDVTWIALLVSAATDGTLGIDGLDAYLLTNTGDSDDVSNYAVFDNSNSAWITTTAAYTPGSAWSRFSHAFTTPAGCTSVRLYVARTVDAASYKYITISGLTASTEYTFSWYALAGSAVNNVYVDGVQLEVGGVATSIIHTVGSAATRTVDDETPFAQVSGNVDETKGMLVFDLNSSVAAADLPATTAIVSLADAVNSLFRLEAAADELKSFDGTNTASDSLAFAKDNWYRFAVRWSADDSEMQVGYKDVTGAGSWQWGAVETFDGAYVVGTDINMFFSGPNVPQRVKNVRIYESDQGTAWIEANF